MAKLGYMPELDGLRGLAATMVVAFHWAPQALFWFWWGVPMFFVLSGYLIGRIILEDLLDGRFSLRNFYIRRALRIWPAYYAALAAILLYHALAKGAPFFSSAYFTDWQLSLVFLQFTPLYFTEHGNPYAIFEFLPGMLPVWTLAVEEQFYLAVPLILMLVMPRWGLRGAMITMCAVIIGGITAKQTMLPPVLLLTQMDCLAMGVLIACVTVQLSRNGRLLGNRHASLAYVVLMLLGILSFIPYFTQGYTRGAGPAELFERPLLWSQAALIFAGVIGYVTVHPHSRLFGWLRTRVLGYLGGISYAMYLFHVPILSFIKPKILAWMGPDLRWLGIMMVIALIIGLPHLSAILLERPILSLKHRFPTGNTG